MIGEIMRTAYICTLDGKIQSAIRNDLTELGLCAEDISRAMDSRLCDLEDTIDIEKYLQLEDFATPSGVDLQRQVEDLPFAAIFLS